MAFLRARTTAHEAQEEIHEKQARRRRKWIADENRQLRSLTRCERKGDYCILFGLAPSIFETAPRMGTTRYWILSATAEALGRVPSGRALTGLDSAIWVSSLAIALRTSLAAVFI